MAKYTINDFQRDFPDDDACLDKILELRYGPEPKCPNCAKKGLHRVSGRRQYACQWCGHQVAPCVGTPFEKSSTSLWKWFYAMYLFTSSRHGVPAKELERQLGVTYKTAWRMGHKLRELMAEINGSPTLEGHVEADETYVGGYKARGKHGGSVRDGKTILFGLVERGGSVVTQTIEATSKLDIDPVIDKYVPWGTIISTDEAGVYTYLDRMPYQHGTVNHSKKNWRKGIHHTNTIEGCWSRLKNSIKGTHIHVSGKWLDNYSQEFCFRYNNRKQKPGLMFGTLLSGLLRRH
jgi:transposase-like protein